jgi:hypothetical protein
MPKTAKKAAAAIVITEPCDRDVEGFGALPFVKCERPMMTATRKDVSELKAALLAAGFESAETSVREYLDGNPDAADLAAAWNDGDDVSQWNPLDSMNGPGWTMVAVLDVSDSGDATNDAVAVFARPAGMVDQVPQDKPWPFPKTEGGGPEAQSETPPAGPVEFSAPLQDMTDGSVVPEPAPAMTKSEAHLGRKSAQFELLEPTDALLKTFTPRVEKHGEDDVSAASLGLQIEAPNTILDLLSPSLRPTLYAAPEGQVTLPGVEESTPLLRTKVIETLKLSNCYEGWTLKITAGLNDITISDCKVDKFVVTPRDGGSVQLDLRIGSSDIDETEAGWLYGHLRHDIEITLHAPQAKPAPIDGSTEAFKRDHPDAEQPEAGDLFAQQHGDQDDEREPDIGDGVEGDDDGPPLDSDDVVHDVVESEGVAS